MNAVKRHQELEARRMRRMLAQLDAEAALRELDARLASGACYQPARVHAMTYRYIPRVGS